MNRRQKGLTLVEVMIVVAIIAILSAIAAPSFSRLIEQYSINVISEKMATDIKFARSESIRTQRPVFFYSTASANTATGNRCWGIGNLAVGTPVTAANSVCSCATNACTVSNYSTNKQFGVGAATSIAFNQNLPTAANRIALTSSNGAFQIQINVNPVGNITRCVPAGSPTFARLPTCLLAPLP